jgi:hypothetical protein
MSKVVSSLVVLCLVGTAFGGGGWWTGAYNSDFNNRLNYSSYQAPGAGDQVLWDESGFDATHQVLTLNDGQTGTCGTLMGMASWTDAAHPNAGVFQMNGGTLNVGDVIYVCSSTTYAGSVMNFVNGTINVTNPGSTIEVGMSRSYTTGVYSTSTWNQWGGTASASYLDLGYTTLTDTSGLGGIGVVNMYGGVMEGTDPKWALYIENSSCVLNLAGGKVVLAGLNNGGTTMDDIDGWIQGGQIVGYGGTQGVLVTTDSVTGQVTLQAVPEPATMTLLGVGLIGFLRRKAR